ncbi:MAG: hypothetical protein WC718_12725, partial [Phycisphaerales bacterium]
MGKYNIDDILSELGVDSGKNKAAGDKGKNAPKQPQLPAARLEDLDPAKSSSLTPLPGQKPHRIDRAPDTFSPLPSMPANQRAFGIAGPAGQDSDPAVKQKAIIAPIT